LRAVYNGARDFSGWNAEPVRPELRQAIELLRKSDAESIDRALQLLHRTVLSFGMKVCGHREDAEDTVQEVLFHSLPHLAKLEDPKALSAWLYTAARNRCLRNRSKASYRRAIALEDLLPSDTELNELLLADPGANPEKEAASRQDRRMLHEAVLRLPVPYRLVLVLHDMEELDTETVARVLSLQAATVRVRLHRARLMVRQEMGRVLDEEQKRPKGRKKPVQRSAECREIFSNLSDYLDGKLQPKTCDAMRRHIEGCPACVAFIRDLKQAIDRCRSLEVCPDAAAPPVLRRLLTEEYLRLIKNSSAIL
jgi:RNA polymerase sigma-70 factor (ECF subfamily)